jgi:hypothetical protein
MSESMNAKIQKLLRLAERAGTPAEAENASRAAERLMLKWGIEEAMLRSTMGGDEKPEAIVTKYTTPYAKAFIKPRHHIAASVVKGMGNMRVWISGTSIVIMGFESDVDRALTLIPSLTIQADHAVAAWWRSYEMRSALSAAEAKRAKRNFLFAFGNEVKRRLTEMRDEEVAATTNSTSTALVLRDRDALVQEEYQAIANRLRAGRSVKGSLHGSAAGREAGSRATLGGASLGSGARGALGSR